MLMVYSWVTTSLMAEQPFFSLPFFAGAFCWTQEGKEEHEGLYIGALLLDPSLQPFLL
jgi:hypothetical protein